MATNDLYNDSNGITTLPLIMTSEQARIFMREVYSNPTHPEKEWVVRYLETDSRVYYNFKD